MACNGDVRTTAGTTIAIGPAPATFDEAGFAAVSYDLIGEVASIGTIGNTYNTATRTPLADRAVIETKTSYTRGNPELGLAISDSDPGQIAARAALNSDDCYSIKITRQSGAIIYLAAQVSAFTVTFDTDEYENGSIMLLAQSDNINVAAP